MANYANLLATIAANIYTNGNNEVTAAMVKSALDAMVASLGAGYQFMGVAHPGDTPSGYTDLKCFWLASEDGIYTNFGNVSVYGGRLCAITYDGSWGVLDALSLINPEQKILNNLIAGSYMTAAGVISSISGWEVSVYRVNAGKHYKITCTGYFAPIQLTAVGFASVEPTIGTSVASIFQNIGGVTTPIDVEYTPASDGWICTQNSSDHKPVNVYEYADEYVSRTQLANSIIPKARYLAVRIPGAYVNGSARVISSITGNFYVTAYEVKAGHSYKVVCSSFQAFSVLGIYGFCSTTPDIGEAVSLLRLSKVGTQTINDTITAESDGYIVVQNSVNNTPVYFYENILSGISISTFKVQLFGDSITDETWGDLESWATFMNGYMLSHFAQVKNEAHSGWYLCNAWDEHSAVWNIQQVLDADSDIIVVFAGTNDWSSGGDCLGTFGTSDQATIYGAVQKIIEYVAANSDAQLIFCTPIQRNSSEEQTFPVNDKGQRLNSAGYTLEDFCDAIKEVCEFYSIPCIDLYHSVGINKENITRVTADGLHPNMLGDKLLAKKICSAIEDIVIK